MTNIVIMNTADVQYLEQITWLYHAIKYQNLAYLFQSTLVLSFLLYIYTIKRTFAHLTELFTVTSICSSSILFYNLLINS